MEKQSKKIEGWVNLYFILVLLLAIVLMIVGLIFCFAAKNYYLFGICFGVGLGLLFLALPIKALLLGFANIVANQEREYEKNEVVLPKPLMSVAPKDLQAPTEKKTVVSPSPSFGLKLRFKGNSYSVIGFEPKPIAPQKVTIPEYYDDGKHGNFPISTIGDIALQYAPISELTLPKSIRLIGYHAFETNRLQNLTFEGTKAEWSSISFGMGWHEGAQIAKIHCSDGDILL